MRPGISKILQAAQRSTQTLQEAIAELESTTNHTDLATYASLLRRCARERDLPSGWRIHAHILASGRGSDVFLSNLLLHMYGKCGSLADAQRIFDLQAQRRNLYSWTAMIAANAQCGHCKEALVLFHRMNCEGLRVAGVTFVAVLGACAKLRDLAQGQHAHQRILSSGGFSSNIAVANSLITMYASCGFIDLAREVFDGMYIRNVVSWNSMIVAYTQARYFGKALDLFDKIKVEPDRVTFVTALGACSDFQQGKMIHDRILALQIELDAVLGTALLNFYSKIGRLNESRDVFDAIQRKDPVSWSAMIAGYAQNGHCKLAVELFWRLDQEGIHANQVTFISVVDACSGLGDLRQGKGLHARILELGFDSHITVKNTLLNLHGKLGSLEDAEKVFHSREEKNVASWNAMIAAYTRHGHGSKAAQTLELMDFEGTKPDEVTLSGIFDACGDMGDLASGRKLHIRIRGGELEQDVTVANSLINMYSRCWSVVEAELVFHRMTKRDLISWNSLIAANAMHGHPAEALDLFRELSLEGFAADNFTFTSTLFACSHGGFLKESLEVFASMVGDYQAVPSPQHYGCVLDLLGRMGKLGEAEELIGDMPLEPDSVAWMSLLGACSTHSDATKASGLADSLVELQPEKAAHYVVFTNVATKFE
ncbi:pentatricopeptide repeat-containing protein DOT4, chloroplastic [Selaginella moellendorffii]|nr:pentatricopeptide repeat-containing protein DOT4, chloroplastic [Selaginella moellendorffii]|eukprot:XP_002978731.2 pentatricopeptide repeat-containing protein DOT4, chloroplastic [Selaginella moellendorffii]